MAVASGSWTIFDPKGAVVSQGKASNAGSGDVSHISNFIDAIRTGSMLNSPIIEGQKSTMLCHLGNIAYRTNTVVQCDPKTGKMLDNPAALKLWGRDAYRHGWEVKV